MSRIKCIQLVERVTAYLDGALDADATAAVDDHLRVCQPCWSYRDEFLVTLKLLSSLSGRVLPPTLEVNLLAGDRR